MYVDCTVVLSFDCSDSSTYANVDVLVDIILHGTNVRMKMDFIFKRLVL